MFTSTLYLDERLNTVRAVDFSHMFTPAVQCDELLNTVQVTCIYGSPEDMELYTSGNIHVASGLYGPLFTKL